MSASGAIEIGERGHLWDPESEAYMRHTQALGHLAQVAEVYQLGSTNPGEINDGLVRRVIDTTLTAESDAASVLAAWDYADTNIVDAKDRVRTKMAILRHLDSGTEEGASSHIGLELALLQDMTLSAPEAKNRCYSLAMGIRGVNSTYPLSERERSYTETAIVLGLAHLEQGFVSLNSTEEGIKWAKIACELGSPELADKAARYALGSFRAHELGYMQQRSELLGVLEVSDNPDIILDTFTLWLDSAREDKHTEKEAAYQKASEEVTEADERLKEARAGYKQDPVYLKAQKTHPGTRRAARLNQAAATRWRDVYQGLQLETMCLMKSESKRQAWEDYQSAQDTFLADHHEAVRLLLEHSAQLLAIEGGSELLQRVADATADWQSTQMFVEHSAQLLALEGGPELLGRVADAARDERCQYKFVQHAPQLLLLEGGPELLQRVADAAEDEESRRVFIDGLWRKFDAMRVNWAAGKSDVGVDKKVLEQVAATITALEA